MKQIATAVFLLASASQAGAVAQFTSTSMACSALKAAVNQQGAAIVRYQSTRVPGLPLYDRYVRNNLFCPGGDVTELDYVPAKDTKFCPLSRCTPLEFDVNHNR